LKGKVKKRKRKRKRRRKKKRKKEKRNLFRLKKGLLLVSLILVNLTAMLSNFRQVLMALAQCLRDADHFCLKMVFFFFFFKLNFKKID